MVLGVGGQFVWLARASGAISLADAVAIEGIIVAVTSGAVAIRIALRHELRLSGVSSTLQEVSRTVQTRPIGEFPLFVLYIAQLIDRAEKSVVVVCDHPGFGIFSDGRHFDAYLAALKRKIATQAEDPKFSVDLMFFADAERRQVHRDQVRLYVPSTEDWASWRNEAENRRRLTEFLERARRIRFPGQSPPNLERRVDDLTLDAYIRELDACDLALLRHHFHGARRHLLEFPKADGIPLVSRYGPSIYFWMRDNVQAVFAVVPMGDQVGQAKAVAFETSDPSMIDALRGIFERYKRASTALYSSPP